MDTDTDFMKLVSKAKQLLSVDYVDELKGEQAEMLRQVLAEIMVYVQQKIQEEESEEEEAPEEAPEAPEEPPAPAPAPAPAPPQGPYQAPLPGATPTPSSMMMSAGGRKKGSKKHKQKGGDIHVAANIDRVMNSDGIPNTKNDPQNMTSRDTIIGSALHPAFTAGRVQPMSSMVGLTDAEKMNMLPNVGGQSGGGRKKRASKK